MVALAVCVLVDVVNGVAVIFVGKAMETSHLRQLRVCVLTDCTCDVHVLLCVSVACHSKIALALHATAGLHLCCMTQQDRTCVA